MSIASQTSPRLAVLWLLTMAAPGRAQSPVAAAPGSTPLVPGDAIRTTFWREPQMSGEYRVDETGSVLLPLLGARNVQGVVPSQLKAQLTSDYGRELRSPEDVQIVLLRRVRVLGAVKQPGLYLVDPTMTVADVVALAGGVTGTGKMKGIRIMRNGREIRTDLNEQTRVGEQLSSGDQVLVPERSWFSRQGVFLLAGTISALSVVVTQLRR